MASWVKTLSANQGCASISLNCGYLQYKEHNVWRTSSTLRFRICSSQDDLAWKHLNHLMDGGWNLFLKIHQKICTIVSPPRKWRHIAILLVLTSLPPEYYLIDQTWFSLMCHFCTFSTSTWTLLFFTLPSCWSCWPTWPRPLLSTS